MPKLYRAALVAALSSLGYYRVPAVLRRGGKYQAMLRAAHQQALEEVTT